MNMTTEHWTILGIGITAFIVCGYLWRVGKRKPIRHDKLAEAEAKMNKQRNALSQDGLSQRSFVVKSYDRLKMTSKTVEHFATNSGANEFLELFKRQEDK